MPTYLAHPWAAFWQEDHPRIRLHWLVDTAELTVRWAVALALAEVVHANHGALPAGVVGEIHEQIERPTLGKWLGVLRALGAEAHRVPLLAEAVFQFRVDELEPRFRSEGQGADASNSLLLLRNTLAHGGFTTRRAAEELLARHQAGWEALLRATLALTHDLQIIALESGRAHLLLGVSPREYPVPEALAGKADGPWLVGKAGALPLLPLAGYAPVCRVGPDGLPANTAESTTQMYTRADKRRLTYTPLGRDEAHSEVLSESAIREFRRLFHLDERPAAKAAAPADGFAWDDFVREARVEAEDMVGRAVEVALAKSWLKAPNLADKWVARMGWIYGSPGTGKSKLMALLVRDYWNPKQRGLFGHRFRAGDARNSRRSFLQLLQSALWDWEPLAAVTSAPTEESFEGKALEQDVLQRLEKVAGLQPAHPRAPAPGFWVFVDGLDEVAAGDPQIAVLIQRLALPGTVWLVAGRDEHGLGKAFSAAGCESLFADGLPPMSAADIRAMLMEGLGNARYALLRRDDPDADDARNVFVDRVVARAQGLPLYVHLLLEDLRSGQLSVHDENKLPDGLTAYYDALIARMGISTIGRDLPLIVSLLARSQEPLGATAIAILLAGDPGDADGYQARTEAALRAGCSLLRSAPTRDGGEGWTLYHQSFRDHVSGTAAKPPAPALAGVVRDAEKLLCRMSLGWASLPAGNLRNHLFRWGVEYLLAWRGEDGMKAARSLLTDFAYLQARTGALPAADSTSLAGDYARVLARMQLVTGREEFRLWEAFFQERMHILRRGDAHWPANRILLQLAVEHADDSPVTRAAESWLAGGNCDWLWLRQLQRPAKAGVKSCLRVFEGHTEPVAGVVELADGRLVSWPQNSCDELFLWSAETGQRLAVLEGHTESIEGALQLADGRLLSWSWNELILWSTKTPVRLAVLKGHKTPVYGVLQLAAGRLLSWSKDGTLILWSAETGAQLVVMKGHTDAVVGAVQLDDRRLLSWSLDQTLIIWSAESGEQLAALKGHNWTVDGALQLAGGRLLSWSRRELILWSAQTGEALAVLKEDEGSVDGVLQLAGGGLLSWSRRELILWSVQTGAPLAVLKGHTDVVMGALQLVDGRLLSWSQDNTLILWSAKSGERLAVCNGHTDLVAGALELADGRLLSWSWDQTLILWSAETGQCLKVLGEHQGSVTGARQLASKRLLSWSGDATLRLWSSEYEMKQGHSRPTGIA
jgi:WD40 repeat protein